MTVYHLAVDIGASSGRHILGYLEDGILKLSIPKKPEKPVETRRMIEIQ